MLQGFIRFTPPPGRLILPDVCCDVTLVDDRPFVSGALTHARESLHVGREIVLLRIGILAAREILQVPLSELTDLVVPLEEVNRSLARYVAERCETDRLAECFGRGPNDATDARFAAAASALARGDSVRAVAARVALSGRQLERVFADRVGIAPKPFTRIVRFRRAVIAASEGTPLAAAAAASGYADQPHFTREVKELTGRTTRALLPNVGFVQDDASWRHVGCE